MLVGGAGGGGGLAQPFDLYIAVWNVFAMHNCVAATDYHHSHHEYLLCVNPWPASL